MEKLSFNNDNIVIGINNDKQNKRLSVSSDADLIIIFSNSF